MLVLTRKPGESVRIGDDVTVTVLGGPRGRPVRLGVDAPGEVTVHREEVCKRVRGGGPDPSQSSAGPTRQR